MSNEKKYRYVKFDRLSDAVRAWEDGEQLYSPIDRSWIDDFCPVGLNENRITVFKDAEYYRREEIKPFECTIWVSFSGVVSVVDPSSRDKPEMIKSENGDVFRKVKMREVIE